MHRFVFSSHDGFGLGHVRRNTLIAQAILQLEPDAEITLVTGLGIKPSWHLDPRIRVVRVPPLLKDSDGSYRHDSLPFDEALDIRAACFTSAVERARPDVVIVDRHPFGIANELRPGLALAKSRGARLAIGLRDILDEPDVVRAEIAGRGWDGVPELFDQVLVYGGTVLCDHEREYALPVPPTYCGWVVEHPGLATRDPELVVVTAGGGGDGRDVFDLGIALFNKMPQARGVLVAGPYAAYLPDDGLPASVRVERDVPGCVQLFARCGAVIQMAGYNSTFESLVAGVRPILVPRRSPRREQAIRATRLASLGLADVVDRGASVDEVAWLLRRERLLSDFELEQRGIDTDGASNAARELVMLADGENVSRRGATLPHATRAQSNSPCRSTTSHAT